MRKDIEVIQKFLSKHIPGGYVITFVDPQDEDHIKSLAYNEKQDPRVKALTIGMLETVDTLVKLMKVADKQKKKKGKPGWGFWPGEK